MDSDLEMKFLIQAEEMDDEELRYYPNWRYYPVILLTPLIPCKYVITAHQMDIGEFTCPYAIPLYIYHIPSNMLIYH